MLLLGGKDILLHRLTSGQAGLGCTKNCEVFRAKCSLFGKQHLGENIPKGFKACSLLALAKRT